MTIITKSEEIRLQSLREKKRTHKAREHLIQKALSDINNTAKNKIIFDDEFDKQQSIKSKNLKNDLFDSDGDSNNDERNLWNEDQFSTSKTKHKKITLGNDARFTLDDRFMEDDHQSKEPEFVGNIHESDLQIEKEKQLNILGSILGTPFKPKFQETKEEIKPAKKGLMIRYDPTETKHCEYEVQPAKSENKEKKTKKRKLNKSELNKPEIEEPTTAQVSKDIYYSVSNTLTESLKHKEEFSLLKIHGKEKDDTEDKKNKNVSIVENKDKTFRFNFNTRNAFKCDSSDEEEINPALGTKKQLNEDKNNIHTNSVFGYKNTLFFEKDDARFNEAVQFFNTEATSSNEFNNLRRKLKLIVRSKIRNNEKKTQQGKKRKVKKVK